jgi:lysophospholipase L1-like esterase
VSEWVEIDPVEAGILRGSLWPGTDAVPYPRADPADAVRLPADTWAAASLPVGVHLEWQGEAEEIELGYTTATDDLGYRGEGAGRCFSLWWGDACLTEVPAVLGRGTARLPVGALLRALRALEGVPRSRAFCAEEISVPSESHASRRPGEQRGWHAHEDAEPGGPKPAPSLEARVPAGPSSAASVPRGAQRATSQSTEATAPFRCYLPEGMRPRLDALRVRGGSLGPAPRRPQVVVYGDSIVEGWCATGPAWAWPCRLERALHVEVTNLGYAGAARGEVASAEQIASLERSSVAALVVAYGTNCWTRVPHSVAMLEAGLAGFLDIVRQGHPDVLLVAVSPIVRPDAERTPNRLGATLADLRVAFERTVTARIRGGDDRLWLVPGERILDARALVDGIHPGNAGHRAIADAVAGVLRRAMPEAA